MAKKSSLLNAFKGLTQKKGTREKEIEKYEKILEESPDDRNALNTLGDLYAKQGAPEKAFEHYLRVGGLYAKDGFTLKAIAVYKKAQRARPKVVSTYIELADLYAQKGLIGEAKSNYLAAAEMQAAKGDKHGSLDTYRKIADLDPNNISIRSKLAEMYEKEEFIEDAAVIYAEIGDAVIRNDQEQAKAYYQRAMMLQPENPRILARIGYAYVDQELRADATEIFEKLLVLEPDNMDYQEQLDELLAEDELLAVATEPEQVVTTKPSSSISFSEDELITSLNFGDEAEGEERDNVDQSDHLVDFSMTEEASPNEASEDDHTLDFTIDDQNQGGIDLEDNQGASPSAEAQSEADNLLDFSFEQSPGEPVGVDEQPGAETTSADAQYFDLASRLDTSAKLGVEYDNQAAQYGQQPSLKVEAPENLANNEISAIIQEFKQGVLEEVGEEDYETHYELGISYKEMSLLDDAIEELKLAALEPSKYVECLGVIGLCYIEKGEPANAIQAFQKARTRVEPQGDEYQDLTYQIGVSYEQTGKTEKAIHEFQTLYQLHPEYRDVKQRLNRLLA